MTSAGKKKPLEVTVKPSELQGGFMVTAHRGNECFGTVWLDTLEKAQAYEASLRKKHEPTGETSPCSLTMHLTLDGRRSEQTLVWRSDSDPAEVRARAMEMVGRELSTFGFNRREDKRE